MRQLLIIKASEDIPDHEINNVISQVGLYGIESNLEEVLSFDQLEKALNRNRAFDYIYLATHGCEDYWGSISGDFTVSWIDFAAMICQSEISKPDTIFIHSCCRGGLNQVAWSMFYCCPKIQYVCGPRNKVTSVDLITAFSLFLYNIEVKRIDPVVAAEKVLNATDIRLVCFDRVDEMSNIGYHHHCQTIKPVVDIAFGIVADSSSGFNHEPEIQR